MESSTHGSHPPFKKTKVDAHKVPRNFFYIDIHYFELQVISTKTTVHLASIPKEMTDLIKKDVKSLANLKDSLNVPKLGSFCLIGNGIFVYFHKVYHTFSSVALSRLLTFSGIKLVSQTHV